MNSHQVLDILKSCSFNWFAFVMALKSKLTDITDEALKQLLLDFGRGRTYALDVYIGHKSCLRMLPTSATVMS